MQRHFLLAIGLCFAILINAQNVSFVNGLYVNENGEAFTGTFIQKFESGNKKSELNIIKGQPEGYAAYYYESGVKMEAGNYVNGQRNGLWESWNAAGTKQLKQITSSV